MMNGWMDDGWMMNVEEGGITDGEWWMMDDR